ncbi:4a-hydroxytetrahydrobiopterin dehydratase [Pontibacter cellulosilyticus]|uniref:4a-hydroxytetrahydrobiopterin dehydratase n=1 Tax=Pontibacter cellulosilyticus TaxID=1720253 RepID=A0A923N431_9BACT|nr:4a-hydroxytetrahydrobiopterin dehydratase [Pontibacter cellulosilyticus]
MRTVHCDLHIYFERVTVKLWTHAAIDLFENNFIMAATIDKILV